MRAESKWQPVPVVMGRETMPAARKRSESRAVARRELARNRLATLGVRLMAPQDPRDHTYWSDTELLNLITMRGVEEANVVAAGEALLAHFARIRQKLAEDQG